MSPLVKTLAVLSGHTSGSSKSPLAKAVGICKVKLRGKGGATDLTRCVSGELKKMSSKKTRSKRRR
jgi:hypothetical protein